MTEASLLWPEIWKGPSATWDSGGVDSLWDEWTNGNREGAELMNPLSSGLRSTPKHSSLLQSSWLNLCVLGDFKCIFKVCGEAVG